MSFMHMDALTAATTEPTVVTLTGGSASHVSGTFARGGFIFRADGTCDRVRGFSEIPFAPDTDWIIPNDSASVNYEIRAHVTSGPLVGGSSATEIFLTLDTERNWINSCSRFCFQTTNLIIDIRWQDGSDTSINNVSSLFDGANVMATAFYDIFLEAS